MARKSKKQVQEELNNSQKVNTKECADEQTTFNTDPISELVEDGVVEHATV